MTKLYLELITRHRNECIQEAENAAEKGNYLAVNAFLTLANKYQEVDPQYWNNLMKKARERHATLKG